MRGIRLRDIIKLSVVIAMFHIVMPLMGMFTGQYVSTLLGDVATIAAGLLLVLLGGHMIYSSLRGESVQSFDHRTMWGMLLFALSVSIDSFSVGISLGMFAADVLLTVLLIRFFWRIDVDTWASAWKAGQSESGRIRRSVRRGYPVHVWPACFYFK